MVHWFFHLMYTGCFWRPVEQAIVNKDRCGSSSKRSQTSEGAGVILRDMLVWSPGQSLGLGKVGDRRCALAYRSQLR